MVRQFVGQCSVSLSDLSVTFLKLKLSGLDLMCKANRAGFHVALPKGCEVTLNDLARKTYKSVLSFKLPIFSARSLLSVYADSNRWLEAASFRCDAFMDLYRAPAGWQQHSEKQLLFVATQDYLTKRAPFLYDPNGAYFYYLNVNPLMLKAATDGIPHGMWQGALYLTRAVRAEKPESVGDVTHLSSHLSLGRISRVTDSPSGRRRHPVEALRSDSGDEEERMSEADRDAILAYVQYHVRLQI